MTTPKLPLAAASAAAFTLAAIAPSVALLAGCAETNVPSRTFAQDPPLPPEGNVPGTKPTNPGNPTTKPDGSTPATPDGAPVPTSDGGPPPPPTGKWVGGYHVGYQRDLYPAEQIDFRGITHLMVGRIRPNADGSLDTAFDIDTTNGPLFGRQMATLAHQNTRKAVLMVGGDDSYDGFVGASNAQNRATFVANLVAFAKNNGFDGLDLDWEPINSGDEPNALALAKALRAAWPTAILTVPVAWNDPAPAFYGQLAAVVDQINIMSYSMADAWPGWQSWHSSALFGESATTPTSIDKSVKAYTRAGVPKAKLGMGIGFYGSCWAGGPTAPKQSPGNGVVASDNVMSYTNIMKAYHSATARKWDATAKVPYLGFPGGTGPQGCTFVSYDDAESVAEKGKYAKDNGLGGTIVWTIAQGYVASAPAGQRSPLLEATRKGFLE